MLLQNILYTQVLREKDSLCIGFIQIAHYRLCNKNKRQVLLLGPGLFIVYPDLLLQSFPFMYILLFFTIYQVNYLYELSLSFLLSSSYPSCSLYLPGLSFTALSYNQSIVNFKVYLSCIYLLILF